MTTIERATSKEEEEEERISSSLRASISREMPAKDFVSLRMDVRRSDYLMAMTANDDDVVAAAAVDDDDHRMKKSIGLMMSFPVMDDHRRVMMLLQLRERMDGTTQQPWLPVALLHVRHD